MRYRALKRRLGDRSYLKKRLDAIFSKVRRLEEADSNGYCTCITCGKRVFWKEIQNGHYITRNHMATRWLRENTAPQCVGCNVFGGGKPDIFALRIKERYGEDALEKLNLAKNQISKWTNQDIVLMIKLYTDEFNRLTKELKNGTP